jgi:3-isopropylmalate/(R)-2-methylmalate dehydratase large subunit
MPRTIIQKLWDSHVVQQSEGAPTLLFADLHLVHEVTSPQAFQGLRERGLKVRRPDLTIATADHAIPTSDRSLPILDEIARKQLAQLETNCAEFGIRCLGVHSDKQGIVHVIGPELGLTQPGMTVVCGDSHTATHGAFGALAFGIGTSEVEHVLATQCLLQRRSKSFEVKVEGSLRKGVSAKDIILALIAKIGIGGGTASIFEYTGSATRALSMEERMTVCNMSIEAGARAGMVAPDDTTFEYLHGRPFSPAGAEWDAAVARWRALPTDDGAPFDRVERFDAASLEPMITYGTNPGMGVAVSGVVPDPAGDASVAKALVYMGLKAGQPLLGQPIDVVFIGSCTNSRLSDLRDAARVFAGRKVAPNVRALVVPGSSTVKRQADRPAYLDLGVYVAAVGGAFLPVRDDGLVQDGPIQNPVCLPHIELARGRINAGKLIVDLPDNKGRTTGAFYFTKGRLITFEATVPANGNLASPDPDFLYALALNSADAVPAGTPLRTRRPLPATGPYMFAAFDPKHAARLVRNPRFREWAPGAQPDGFPDRIVMRFGGSTAEHIGAVEHGVRHVGDLRARGPERAHHRLQHLRRGDRGPAGADRRLHDALLLDRHALEGNLERQVAARDHHRVGAREDRVEVLERELRLDLRDQTRGSAQPFQRAAHDRHVLFGPHVRHAHQVDAQLGAELEVPLVALGQDRPRRHGARRVHALAARDRPAQDHAAVDLGSVDVLDLELDRAVAQKNRGARPGFGREVVVGNRQVRGVALVLAAGEHDPRARLEHHVRWHQLAQADLRPRQVLQDRDGTPRLGRSGAHARHILAVLRVGPVGEVDPRHVHAGVHETAQNLRRPARRPDGAHDVNGASAHLLPVRRVPVLA